MPQLLQFSLSDLSQVGYQLLTRGYLATILHFFLSNLSQVGNHLRTKGHLAASFALFPIKFVPNWRPPKYLQEAILPQILHIFLSNLPQVKKKTYRRLSCQSFALFPIKYA